MAIATAHVDVKNLEQVTRLVGALGRFYQALSGDTVRAMSDAEALAYINLQDSMREFGILRPVVNEGLIYSATELDASRAIPGES